MRTAIITLLLLAIAAPFGYFFIEDVWRKEALFDAVRAQDKAAITKALKDGATLLQVDGSGQSALHLASYKAGPEIVKFLLQKKAPLEAKDKRGATPLHWATINGELENAEILIKAGADVNARDATGATPLFWAVSGITTFDVEKFVMAALLLNNYADPNIKNQRGQTALAFVRLKKIQPLVDMLEPITRE